MNEKHSIRKKEKAIALFAAAVIVMNFVPVQAVNASNLAAINESDQATVNESDQATVNESDQAAVNESDQVVNASNQEGVSASDLAFDDREQIKVEDFSYVIPEGYLYLGGTTKNSEEFLILPPKGARCVRFFNEDYKAAKCEYIIRYGTTDPSVAGVTEEGTIVAVGEGTAVIMAVIELRDGSTQIYEHTVTVKKATIQFTSVTERLAIGESFIFQVKLCGYNESDLIWMTARRGGAVVAKNYGKCSAEVVGVSAKTDTVYVQVGTMIHSIPIQVTEKEE